MRPLALLLLLAALAPPVRAEEAPLPDVTRALREDPPLPGEPLDGWPGLGEPPAEGPTWTVEDAVALALARSPSLSAARREVEAARSDRAAAGGWRTRGWGSRWSPTRAPPTSTWRSAST
jgi:hypothetical protein